MHQRWHVLYLSLEYKNESDVKIVCWSEMSFKQIFDL